MESAVNYGIITLIPPIVIIVFALKTKKTFEALLIGAILGFIISAKWDFVSATLDGLMEVISEESWMFLTLGLFGSFIALLTKSKGTLGFADLVEKYANKPKKSLLISWLLGIVIFMDDYLNILTVSSCMRDVSDRQKTPREMLAYVIDSTGAPVCVLVPISTWAIFFGGVFAKQEELAGFGNASEIYLQVLPFILYGWVAVIVVPLVILGVIPKMFGMKKAYDRVESTGMVYSELSRKYNLELEKQQQEERKNGRKTGKIVDFLLPLLVLMGVTIYTLDLLLGLAIALGVCVVLYLPRKVMSFDEFTENLMTGFADMIPMLAICLGALTVKLSMDSIGLPAFVINAVIPYMVPSLFPAITFLIVAGLSFITGSNWGIPAVTVPIIAPLAILSGANPIITLGAIVSGGTFGSHCCFYSDATVLTSQACGMDNLEHAISQFPYALLSAIIAVILFVVFGIAF